MLRFFATIFATLIVTIPLAAQSLRTSDGARPVVCPLGSVMSTMRCDGDFCDDITITCDRNIREVRSVYWSRWAGFKALSGRATCDDFVPGVRRRIGFVSGFACSGDYCDHFAVQCTELELFTVDTLDMSACRTSDWFSDGDATQRRPSPFMLPLTVFCKGRHCDNVRVRYCPMVRRTR